jgi:3'-phosphoadenosine 5'-phosphosulfate sulfotransferase (PAPS reductase)/FAD synthetase
MENNDIICWWSGGVTSAVAIQMAIDIYGLERCRIIFIDTHNEHDDTYRFFKDCEKWYGKEIETLSAIGKGKKYDSIQDVWHQYNSLNVANGAICSSELKRSVRVDFQRKNEYLHQVFGFDIDEPKRAKNMRKNYKVANPIYPLLMFGYTKKQCLSILKSEGVEIPAAYKLGFTNNNCLKTGCVQGGIGYWKKIQLEMPLVFDEMARQEHELTNEKEQPVTCLRDQSKYAKKSGIFQVFLKPHPNYPFHKNIDDMEGRPVENLMECNGFCGTKETLLND